MSGLVPPASNRALVGGGALLIAATTAAEVVTAPYGEAVAAYNLNPAVHVVKVLAVLAFAGGLIGLVRAERDRLGRWGSGAAVILAVATAVATVPYSVVEATLPGDLPIPVANQRLDAMHAGQPWIGASASIALPVILVSIVVLAGVVLRRRAAPRWVPVVSLASIPVAVALLVLGQAYGLPLPHPPTWLYLSLAGYAWTGRPPG